MFRRPMALQSPDSEGIYPMVIPRELSQIAALLSVKRIHCSLCLKSEEMPSLGAQDDGQRSEEINSETMFSWKIGSKAI